MTVILDPQVVATIRRHGREAYPWECCGALLGRETPGGRRIAVALPLENERSQERERRYLIRPGQVLAAEREARARGLLLLGFYHSHPDHPAVPSTFDREHAWPWYTYLILAVDRGRDGDLRGWQLREDRSGFDEVPLKEG